MPYRRRVLTLVGAAAPILAALLLATPWDPAASAQPSARPAAGNLLGTGSAFIQMFTVGGTVSGGKLPGIDATLIPPDAKAKQRFDVSVSAVAGNDDYGLPDKRFGKVEVTLFAVDDRGDEKKVGSQSKKPAKSTGAAEIKFGKLKTPGSHFRVEVEFVGGSLAGGGGGLDGQRIDRALGRSPGRAGESTSGSDRLRRCYGARRGSMNDPVSSESRWHAVEKPEEK